VDKGRSLWRKLAFRAELAENTKLAKNPVQSVKSVANKKPPRPAELNQSNAQGGKSKNLVACPSPVGRSADPAPIELSSRLFGAGPINYEPRTTDNKQRLPAAQNQSKAWVSAHQKRPIQKFFYLLPHKHLQIYTIRKIHEFSIKCATPSPSAFK